MDLDEVLRLVVVGDPAQLGTLLEPHPDVEIAAVFESGSEALRAIDILRPDAVLLARPEADRAVTIRKLKERQPGLLVVAMIGPSQAYELYRMFEAGADVCISGAPTPAALSTWRAAVSFANAVDDRDARAAKNQNLFRKINERVNEVNNSLGLALASALWICECANDTCTDRVEMTPNEYEAVRRDGARFFVFPNEQHVWPDVERVTERNDRYWVVEKTGEAGAVAEGADPRSDDDPLHLKT
jgi:CheY-like chemotaxis protein